MIYMNIETDDGGSCYNSFCDNPACDCDPCECTEFSPCVCCEFDEGCVTPV